jgi:hypothetical protein
VELADGRGSCGEVPEVKADECVLDDGRATDVHAVAPSVFIPGSREYHGPGERIGDAFSAGKQLMADG